MHGLRSKDPLEQSVPPTEHPPGAVTFEYWAKEPEASLQISELVQDSVDLGKQPRDQEPFWNKSQGKDYLERRHVELASQRGSMLLVRREDPGSIEDVAPLSDVSRVVTNRPHLMHNVRMKPRVTRGCRQEEYAFVHELDGI